MLQISIAGVPLLVIVYNDPYAYSFVWCGIIFTVCTTHNDSSFDVCSKDLKVLEDLVSKKG